MMISQQLATYTYGVVVNVKDAWELTVDSVQCTECLDKNKFGGRGRKKKACKLL